MRTKTIALLALLSVALLLPLPATAFWGQGEEGAVNVTEGYDVNTVTTVSGTIRAIHTDGKRPNVELELESGDVRVMICIGPQRYWAERGLPFAPGDEITARGSRAQGPGGVHYLMVREITDRSRQQTTVLRDEAGRPLWAGQGMGPRPGERGPRHHPGRE